MSAPHAVSIKLSDKKQTTMPQEHSRRDPARRMARLTNDRAERFLSAVALARLGEAIAKATEASLAGPTAVVVRLR